MPVERDSLAPPLGEYGSDRNRAHAPENRPGGHLRPRTCPAPAPRLQIRTMSDLAEPAARTAAAVARLELRPPTLGNLAPPPTRVLPGRGAYSTRASARPR